MRLFISLFCFLCLMQQAAAQSGESLTPVQQRITEAMQSDIRTQEERARDDNRKPVQVLDFLGLQEDMRVIELLPFGGWYTKILGPVLRENGQLYVTQPDLGPYSEALIPTLEQEGMDRVEQLDWNGGDAEGENPFIASGDFDVEPVDMVLTFRNYHNFSREDRMTINESVFDALKPGGLYGVVDHTRRHMEPDNQENFRRVDPVLAIREIQESGFEFVDYSDVLRSPEDELVREVGHEDVTGNTDRFTFLFRKPEN